MGLFSTQSEVHPTLFFLTRQNKIYNYTVPYNVSETFQMN